jgi:hypothetical protein
MGQTLRLALVVEAAQIPPRTNLAAGNRMAAKPKLVVIDGNTGEPVPAAFKLRQRVPLPMTPKKQLLEAARTYASVRRGEMPAEIGARLSYMLKTCADLSEVADIEPRLDNIEAKLDSLLQKLML